MSSPSQDQGNSATTDYYSKTSGTAQLQVNDASYYNQGNGPLQHSSNVNIYQQGVPSNGSNQSNGAISYYQQNATNIGSETVEQNGAMAMSSINGPYYKPSNLTNGVHPSLDRNGSPNNNGIYSNSADLRGSPSMTSSPRKGYPDGSTLSPKAYRSPYKTPPRPGVPEGIYNNSVKRPIVTDSPKLEVKDSVEPKYDATAHVPPGSNSWKEWTQQLQVRHRHHNFL